MVKQKVPEEMKAPRGQSAAETQKQKCVSSSLMFSPFTIQDILDASLGDNCIVTFEPLVLVLSDESGVMTAL